jgi:hypothetical protein
VGCQREAEVRVPFRKSLRKGDRIAGLPLAVPFRAVSGNTLQFAIEQNFKISAPSWNTAGEGECTITLNGDDDFAIVGTVNIDYRSMFLHFECCNLLMKMPLIKEIKNDFLETLNKSSEVDLEINKKRHPFKKILSFFLSIFGPLF